MKKSTAGAAVAAAVAGLFIAGNVMAEAAKGGSAAPAPTEVKKVMCSGVNSCKGKGECAAKGSCKGKGGCGGKDGCKGKNSCKGKGMTTMTPDECTKAGGTVAK